MGKQPDDIVRLLQKMQVGDKNALDALYESIYNNLKIIARRFLKNQSAGHTLQTTEIVHEAYLRLLGTVVLKDQDNAVFTGIVANCMRNVLVDYARRKMRQKRAGGYAILPLEETILRPEEEPEILLALDDALERLSLLNDRLCKIVELRYFTGHSIEEVAKLLSMSVATVNRDWRLAKAWLNTEITDGEKHDS